MINQNKKSKILFDNKSSNQMIKSVLTKNEVGHNYVQLQQQKYKLSGRKDSCKSTPRGNRIGQYSRKSIVKRNNEMNESETN